MADEARILAALRNADAAGDTAAATRLAAMLKPAAPSTLAQPKTTRSVNTPAIDPAEGMTPLQRGLVGVGSAFARAGEGLYGLLGGDTSQMQADREVYEQNREALGTAGKVGEAVGGIATTAPAAAVSGGVLPAMAATGALTAATTPGNAQARLKAGAVDAGFAGGAGVLAKSLGRLANPIGQKTDDVLALEAKGIKPTFGQAAGAKGGVLGRSVARAEEAAQSTPFGGSAIRARRAEALEQFQRATREGVLPPGAAPGAANSLDDVRTAYNTAYSSALNSAPLPKEARLWSPNVEIPKITAGTPISTTQRADLKQFVREVQKKHLEAGGKTATAETAHAIQSEIRRAAAKFGSSADPAQRAYGEALGDVAESFGKTWRAGLNDPDLVKHIRAIDRQYAAYVPVRHAAKTNAVSRAPDEYTPNVLLRALRTTDRTPNKSSFIAGTRPQQELATQAETVLTSKLPDSGTAERLGTALGVPLAIASGGTSLLPSAMAAVYGNRAVQDYLMGRASPVLQRSMEQWLRQHAGTAALSAAALNE